MAVTEESEVYLLPGERRPDLTQGNPFSRFFNFVGSFLDLNPDTQGGLTRSSKYFTEKGPTGNTRIVEEAYDPVTGQTVRVPADPGRFQRDTGDTLPEVIAGSRKEEAEEKEREANRNLISRVEGMRDRRRREDLADAESQHQRTLGLGSQSFGHRAALMGQQHQFDATQSAEDRKLDFGLNTQNNETARQGQWLNYLTNQGTTSVSAMNTLADLMATAGELENSAFNRKYTAAMYNSAEQQRDLGNQFAVNKLAQALHSDKYNNLAQGLASLGKGLGGLF